MRGSVAAGAHLRSGSAISSVMALFFITANAEKLASHNQGIKSQTVVLATLVSKGIKSQTAKEGIKRYQKSNRCACHSGIRS